MNNETNEFQLNEEPLQGDELSKTAIDKIILPQEDGSNTSNEGEKLLRYKRVNKGIRGIPI